MAEPATVDAPHASGGRSVARTPGASTTVEVALLDPSGVIVSVNDAWTAFGAANGADPERIGVGVSYLDACDAASDDRYAREMASTVRTALRGDLPAPTRMELPCHAPGTSRWFDVLVSSRFDDGGACLGATVTLSPTCDIPVRPLRPARADRPANGTTVPAFYPDRSERLGDTFAQLLLDRAPIGILVVDDQGVVVRAGRAAEQLFGHGPDGLTDTPVARALPDLRPPDDPAGTDGMGAESARITDGQRVDGTIVPVEVRVGLLPLSRGTGSIVLVRQVAPGAELRPPDQVACPDHGIDGVILDLDEVVRHLFATGMTVTGVAGARHDDQALATMLIGVAEDLDRAVRDLRTVALHLRLQGRRPPFPGDDGPGPDHP